MLAQWDYRKLYCNMSFSANIVLKIYSNIEIFPPTIEIF